MTGCSRCDGTGVMACDNCGDRHEHTCHLDGEEYGPYECSCTKCSMCGGSGKAYPEHLRGHLVAMDTVPGYDPRVTCTVCDGTGRMA